MESDSDSSDSFDDLLRGREPRKRSKPEQASKNASSEDASAPAKKKQKKCKKDKKDKKAKEDTKGAAADGSGTSADGATSCDGKEAPRLKKKPKKKKKASVAVSGNWQALAKTLPATIGKRTREEDDGRDGQKRQKQFQDSLPAPITDDTRVTKYLALDCEMVGVGVAGEESMLAQVVIVNSFGNTVYNKYVAPMEEVVDYRTHVSGIRKEHLDNAPSFETVQREVAEMTEGRIIVGHSLENDLKALLLSHPRKLIRDTARYPPLLRRMPNGRKPRPHALKWLAKTHLSVVIQEGEHDPSIDARAALLLYKKFKKEWEASVARMEKRRGKRARNYERERSTTYSGAEEDV